MMRNVFAILILAVSILTMSATTFTTNFSFNKPGDGDTNYGSLIRANWDSADTQIQANQTSITDHLADTVGAHAATAISTTPGANTCTSQVTVQTYLDCLDGLLDPTVSGVVLIAGAQTITGLKTFSTTPIFSSAINGILNTNGSGIITADTFSTLAPVTTKGDILGFSTTATRIAVGTDGQQLFADSTDPEGVAWGNPNPRWRKFTFAFGDLSAAATTFAVTALTLTAEEGIDAVIVKHTTAFSGGAISAYTVKAGISGNTDKYSNNFDVFQAIGNTVRLVNSVIDVPNFGATTDVIVTATSTGADLDAATAGSVDVYVRTFVLP